MHVLFFKWFLIIFYFCGIFSLKISFRENFSLTKTYSKFPDHTFWHYYEKCYKTLVLVLYLTYLVGLTTLLKMKLNSFQVS